MIIFSLTKQAPVLLLLGALLGFHYLLKKEPAIKQGQGLLAILEASTDFKQSKHFIYLSAS